MQDTLSYLFIRENIFYINGSFFHIVLEKLCGFSIATTIIITIPNTIFLLQLKTVIPNKESFVRRLLPLWLVPMETQTINTESLPSSLGTKEQDGLAVFSFHPQSSLLKLANGRVLGPSEGPQKSLQRVLVSKMGRKADRSPKLYLAIWENSLNPGSPPSGLQTYMRS